MQQEKLIISKHNNSSTQAALGTDTISRGSGPRWRPIGRRMKGDGGSRDVSGSTEV